MFGTENASVIRLGFTPFCIHCAPSLFEAPYVFMGGHDGVHCFGCVPSKDSVQMIEVVKDQNHPLPEFKDLEDGHRGVVSMDSLRFHSKDTAFIVVGAMDGFIKLSQKKKLSDSSWKTERICSKNMNGPISSLSFYAKPGVLDDDESLSLLIGSGSGHCQVHSSLHRHGFIHRNCHFLSEHILDSMDCCDSVLCSESVVIKGCLYLLFGCYSGKLICFGLDALKESESEPLRLLFESQFDQQIHAVMAIPSSTKIAVMTLNKVFFLSFKRIHSGFACDETKIVSV